MGMAWLKASTDPPIDVFATQPMLDEGMRDHPGLPKPDAGTNALSGDFYPMYILARCRASRMFG